MDESTYELSENAFSLFEGTEKDKEALLALHQGYLEANSRGLDVALLRKVWSNHLDCVWFNSTGYTYHGIDDWAKLWDYFGPPCERTAAGRWKSDEAEPHWTGDEWPSRSTEVFRRENGRWICVHVHISTRSTGPRPEEAD